MNQRIFIYLSVTIVGNEMIAVNYFIVNVTNFYRFVIGIIDRLFLTLIAI